jgi:hypothetical protein
MVNPSKRLGQRCNAISLRMIRGRFGSMRIESAAIAATPAAVTPLMNFRRLIGGNANRSQALRSRTRTTPLLLQNNLKKEEVPNGSASAQKLNVACRSIRRTALPVENGPPCKEFGTPKKLDPSTPLGFAGLTLLNTFRTFTPNVRL